MKAGTLAIGAAVLLVAGLAAARLHYGQARPATSSVVVTSSMLECACREVVGESPDEPLAVVCLLPPGSCPGHFDLSPRARPALERASLILRHDYQGALEEKIAQLARRKPAVVAVRSEDSLLIPGQYAALLDEVARALGKSFPARAEEFHGRAEACRGKAAAWTQELQRRAQPWRGRRVIASAHQKQFAQWLGLEVAGEFRRAEDSTPQDLEKLMALKAQGIIANLQEGTQAAQALGQRTGLPVVVFSNFPGAEGYGESYPELLRANLDRLEAAWARP